MEGGEERAGSTALLRTTSLDEACAAAGAAYYPHELSAVGHTRSLDVRIRTEQFGPLTVGSLRYGAEVRLRCGELHTGYQVNIPVTGTVDTQNGRHRVLATRATAAVYLPTGDTTIRSWSADCTLYGVKFDRGFLEAELAALRDRPPATVPLTPSLDVRTSAGRSWLRMVRMLVREVRDGPVHPVVADRLRGALAVGLLLAACPAYRADLVADHAPAPPRAVRIAADALRERPGDPWRVAALARLAGTSVRQLHAGFQRHLGTSPMAFLRDVRLARAHAELTDAEPGTCAVADVAYRWGFAHPGRFATDYRRAYGRPPSETLRTG